MEGRRRLRAEAKIEYKELTRKVAELRNEDPIRVQELIEKNFDRGNQLYSLVKRKLEGTAADSRHMRELVNLCHESSRKINANSRPIDMHRIIKGLMNNANEEEGRQLTKQQFFRHITERHVNTFLLKPPTFEFFYGAFKNDIEIKPKKKREPREKIVETKAVTAQERMEVEVEQDTTPKEVEQINAQINRLTRNKRNANFFATISDPESFTKTVENIFHTSFLIKEGRVGVKWDKSKTPVLFVDQEKAKPSAGEGNQSILSFSMGNYQDWISKFNITRRSLVPSDDDDGRCANAGNQNGCDSDTDIEDQDDL